ncbi:FkbM family methyltransferase [Devosia sp. MC532]|uniref:FkbM family methyltransferase n=1 Tax=Devosia sp. MC532 TaxID=2799788 RepID=UPI0018F6FFFB|nr:FkbM family methyltransferase [Devosia sp. MC532]MBJ7579520.1 FkbM family methyltransferase [Devosia sp. MC532]
MHRITTALGMLAAPAAYVAGRITGNQSLAMQSVHLDDNFLRGYRTRMQATGVHSEIFDRFVQAAKLCASTNEPIDDDIATLFPASHGQLLQDVVCALLHKNKRGGYFVEIGVGDGTTYSNTRLLEKELGWHGILAEPALMFHDSIIKDRTAILDRRAVSSETGTILTFEQDDATGELSGIAGQRTRRGKQIVSSYQVGTIRLDDLLDAYEAPDEIDYISIDTEGSELAVLSGLNLIRRKVSFFTIEHNYDRHRMKKYDELMGNAGYRKIAPHLSSFDYWYAHPDLGTTLF